MSIKGYIVSIQEIYGVLSLYAVVGCMYMETFGCMYAVVGCISDTADSLPDSR